MVPQLHFKTEEKLYLRRERATSSFSPYSSPPYLPTRALQAHLGQLVSRGEQLRCQQDPRRSALARCATLGGGEEGGPEPGDPQEGGEETRRPPAARAAAAEATWAGPAARAGKTPPPT